MKTVLPLLPIILLAFVACKKHKAVTPLVIQQQSTDSLKNTVHPLDTSSRVDNLLGNYYGTKTRTVYNWFKPTNTKDTQITTIDVRIEITKVDRNTFRYSRYDTGTLVHWRNFGRLPDDKYQFHQHSWMYIYPLKDSVSTTSSESGGSGSSATTVYEVITAKR